MDRALWLLIRLQVGGWLRSLVRSLRSPRGLLLALLGLFFFIPWLMLVAAQRDGAMPAEKIRTGGPGVLLLYCLMNVLLSAGEKAVYFSPAEVTFLFTGPFGRRQLLGYKVTLTLLFSLPATLFLSLVFRVHASWFLAALVGLLLMIAFMTLFGMALNLAASAAGARAFTRVRRLILTAAAVAGVLLLASARQGGFEGVLDSDAWRTLSAPLRWFFDAFLADNWLDLLRFGALGLLVNAALLAVVFGLDADYLEAAAAYSARTYAQIQRLRGGPTVSVAGDAPGPPPKPRRALPMPPHLGGVGPLVWRQLTTALRSPRSLVGLVVVQTIVATSLLGVVRSADALEQALSISFGVVGLPLFLTSLLPFDFRGDLDRLEALKMLPLPPWRLALGQMLPPALVLSAFQWVLLAGLAVFACFRGLDGEALRSALLVLLAGAVVALPFNFLLFGLENVLFLLFPSRLLAGAPGDFSAMGRNVLLMLARMLTLGLGGAAAFLVGLGVFHLSGRSLTTAFAAAWVLLACGAAVLVPVAGLCFTRIDVSRDKPA